jgi:beta-N-acetylhexosaminidase
MDLNLLFFIFTLLQSTIFNNQTQINNLINQNFTYEEKLGQLLMSNISPNTTKEIITSLIRDYKIGNFNLIGKYNNEQEVKELINFINKESQKYLKLPPFIAVDEEGYISRLPFLNSLPQNQLKNEEEAYKEAYKRGNKLKQIGFNMIFAPVLDFSINNKDYIWKRTFQKDKEKTINLGKAMLNGFNDSSIISIPKHLPGYINIKDDPHKKISIYKKLDDYKDNLEIFKEILNNNPLGIMSAHIIINDIDDKPITRSKKFIEYLQKNFNYKGLFITDSLGMGSFKLLDNFENAALKSLLSGYNLLILSSNYNVSLDIIKFLNKSLNNPEVQKNINESFIKIYLIKKLKLSI